MSRDLSKAASESETKVGKPIASALSHAALLHVIVVFTELPVIRCPPRGFRVYAQMSRSKKGANPRGTAPVHGGKLDGDSWLWMVPGLGGGDGGREQALLNPDLIA